MNPPTDQTLRPPIRVADTLRDRTVFVIGGTGFLGKVYLYFLLRRHADVRRIFMLIRPKKGADATERLRDEIVPADLFEPLRKSLGKGGFEALVAEKLVAVPGDVTLPALGLSDEWRQRLKVEVDVIVNSAGLVDFNPPMEEAISINAMGSQHCIDMALEWDAALLHVSTCYVAGRKTGAVFEDEEIYGFFPRKAEMEGVTFDPRREVEEAVQLITRTREEAYHQEHQNTFIHEARRKLVEDHRNPDDERALKKELERVRQKWVDNQLSDVGMRRAQEFGWPNTYTYTKSIGEQLVVSTPGLRYSIVRPAIIESSLRHPFPGWNEGINTTAPLIFLSLQGQLNYPAKDKNILDVIPVDMIAGPMIVVTAALIERRNHPVYQLGSSDRNPLYLKRVVELTGLHKRQHYQNRGRGNKILNEVYARFEPHTTPLRTYQLTSSPAFAKLTGAAARTLRETGIVDKVPMLRPVESGLKSFEKQSSRIHGLMEVFLPFIWDFKYRFKTDNIRDLYRQISAEDRMSMPFDPEEMDWLTYWLEVHSPGLEKWVFPKIKDRLRRKPLPEVYQYEDLLELFDATTNNNADRIAFRYLKDTTEETWTYAQVRERAGRVAATLKAGGLTDGDRVLLVSENRPEWGMCYFGILQAGGTVVPVDAKANAREIVNIARAANARGVLISEECLAPLRADIEAALPTLGLWPVDACTRRDEPTPSMALVPARKKEALASLIFTSGTTGVPKGVMLSHRNLTSLLANLAKLFRLNDRDQVLSVLPLHHTFEFAAGFLLPLSRGSTVNYIKTLNGETLTDALRSNKITAMVGVPALWELIHRRIQSKVEERGAVAEVIFIIATTLHRRVREKLGLNLGKQLFGEVHRTFGGRLKYLISGGAALPEEVFDGFDALGFDLYEGYGLTEASPVLAVNRPGHRPVRGSVGTALPGVEIKINNPDPQGLGEIIAKGPNVMAGYLNAPEATEAVLKDGWLYTGDIGRIDKDGNVYIAGRAKEVIVDSSGKNVYPDEVEAIYAGGPYVKDLSVVGLPDGRGSERVAAMVVLDDEKARDDGLNLVEARERFEVHLRHVELTLPYHQRIKVLRYREGDLPRTATRKVKRREVVKLLEGMLKAESTIIPVDSGESTGTLRTLRAALARITGKRVEEIRPDSRLEADLGLDSLMATELLGALEEHGVPAMELQDLVEAGTVEAVAELISVRAASLPVPLPATPARKVGTTQRVRDIFEVSLKRLHEVHVPDDIRLPIKSGLSRAQRWVYLNGFRVKVKGFAFLPQSSNVLVISNHASHLDMGLVKVALGGYGRELVSLAAADYFFADGPRRWYFENFTNAIPLDRIMPRRESIRRAQIMLEQGHNLLLFPEGTRSNGGTIQPFKRGVGMMALRFGVDVLPVYIHGTYRSLPKGAILPRSRELEARIGGPVRYTDLAKITEGMPPLQAQTMVARLLQQAVEALRDHQIFDVYEAAAQEGGAANPLERVMMELTGKFVPEKFEAPSTWYFSLGPDDADKWTLVVDEDGPHIQPGKPEQADCVLKTSGELFTRIVREGYQPGVTDFMTGDIKTSDLTRLQYFQELFGLGDL